MYDLENVARVACSFEEHSIIWHMLLQSFISFLCSLLKFVYFPKLFINIIEEIITTLKSVTIICGTHGKLNRNSC